MIFSPLSGSGRGGEQAPGDLAAKLRSRRCSPSATAERSDTAGRGGRRGQSPQPHVSGQKRQGPAFQSGSKAARWAAGGTGEPPTQRLEHVPRSWGEQGCSPLTVLQSNKLPLAISSLQSHE